MLASLASATIRGIDGQPVTVEVHVGNGLPAFHVVGLPDVACREARDRVRAAILSSPGLQWPSARITVNLAPSGVRKHGSGLDLAIAVGVLAANRQLPDVDLGDIGFVAELGLDGSLRPVPGVLSRVSVVGTRSVVVAPAAAHEAALGGVEVVRAPGSLSELVDCLFARQPWPDLPEPVVRDDARGVADLADVVGHPFARAALEIAAAGGHNLLMVGPPGAGKSMLARRLPGLLPDLDAESALEATKVHSVAGLRLPPGRLLSVPPLRAPHHTLSLAGMIGGGSGRIRPGEISCAHGGVLFLDELGEFAPGALDALRQPLEEGCVRVSRAHGAVTFPARFLLVAAMNPCPCGFLGSGDPCRCSDAARRRYVRRLSGPLLDRIDLRLFLARPDPAALLHGERGEGTAEVRERVLSARARSVERGWRCNGEVPVDALDEVVPLTDELRPLFGAALADGRLSARGLGRVRLVARTIADLAGRDRVDVSSAAAALQLRAQPVLLDQVGGHV